MSATAQQRGSAPAPIGVPAQQVQLRPRRLLETADLSSRFIQMHMRQLCGCLLPIAALAGLLIWLNSEADWPPLLIWASLMALAPLATLPVTAACGELMLKTRTNLRSVYRDAKLAVFRVFAARAVDFLGKSFLLGLTFRTTCFAPEIMLLEHGDLSATFKRSSDLLHVVAGRWIAFALLSLFVPCVGAIAGEVIWQSLRSLFDVHTAREPLWESGATWPALAGAALGYGYLAVVRFLLYIDCRTRREGWDLLLQMSTLTQIGRARDLRKSAAV